MLNLQLKKFDYIFDIFPTEISKQVKYSLLKAKIKNSTNWSHDLISQKSLHFHLYHKRNI